MEELERFYVNPDRIKSYKETSPLNDTNEMQKALERINDREKIIITYVMMF